MSEVDFIKINPLYRDEAAALVLTQFQDKQIYMAIIDLLAQSRQEFNNFLVEMAEARRLPLAIGEQLTEIGRQIGLARTTEDDNDFRAAIYLSSVKRRSDGSRDFIANALYLSSGEYPNLYNGLFRQVDIAINGEVLPSFETIQEVISLLPVNSLYRVIKNPKSGSVFGFSGNPNAKGFASRHQVGGDVGKLASLRATNPIPLARTTNKLPYVQFGYVEAGYVEP